MCIYIYTHVVLFCNRWIGIEIEAKDRGDK